MEHSFPSGIYANIFELRVEKHCLNIDHVELPNNRQTLREGRDIDRVAMLCGFSAALRSFCS